MISYMLGEPFPIKQYAVPGDHLWPIITDQSFDILQSLTDISPNELDAFSEKAIDVVLFRYEQVPFLVFNFGGAVFGEVAINIHKIDKRRLDYWLASDDNAITIFLLEGRTTCIENIRTAEFPLMRHVKEILKGQLNYTSEDIDNQIIEGRSMCNIEVMVALAEDGCTIPEPEIHL